MRKPFLKTGSSTVGHVEPGETVQQCVERETPEETGLLVEKVLSGFEELLWDSEVRERRTCK